jgi:hypothetical protein
MRLLVVVVVVLPITEYKKVVVFTISQDAYAPAVRPDVEPASNPYTPPRTRRAADSEVCCFSALLVPVEDSEDPEEDELRTGASG